MPSKRSASPKVPVASSTSSVRVRAWHAVSICCGQAACEAAIKASGERLLATEAPLLPLKQCDRMDRCMCRYRHHEDRREGPRRRSDGAPPAGMVAGGDNRRSVRGRREEDTPVFDPYATDDKTQSILEDTYYEYVRKQSFD